MRIFKNFYHDSLSVFKKHSIILTIIIILTIVGLALSITAGVDNWWVPLLLGFISVVSLLLFSNYRVVVKASISIMITIVLASIGFYQGNYVDFYTGGVNGLIWLSMTLALFCFCLFISYTFYSGKSRWGILTFTIIFHFILTLVLLLSSLNTVLTMSVSFVASFVFFVIFYLYTPKTNFSHKKMPVLEIKEKLEDNLSKGLEDFQWKFKVVQKNSKNSFAKKFLIYKDNAYMLYPVNMETHFKRKTVLRKEIFTYKGKNINPWLLYLVSKELMYHKTAKSNIVLVLLDTQNRNGTTADLLTVDIPDSKYKIPVLIIPALGLRKNSDYVEKIISMIEENVLEYSEKLTDKQKLIIDGIGVYSSKKDKEEI